MSGVPLSELYAECESTLRVYGFALKVYHNLLDHCPEQLSAHMRELNIFLFAEIKRSVEDEFDDQDAYDLCVLIEGLRADRGGKLW